MDSQDNKRLFNRASQEYAFSWLFPDDPGGRPSRDEVSKCRAEDSLLRARAPALIWSISKHYSMGSFVDKKRPPCSLTD